MYNAYTNSYRRCEIYGDNGKFQHTDGFRHKKAKRIFVQCARFEFNGFPFDVRLDNFNNETVQAIKEADFITEEIKSGRRKPFSSWEEAKKSLTQ